MRADSAVAMPQAGGAILRWTVYDVIEVLRGELVLPFFSTGDARALRMVSQRFRRAVLAHIWVDCDTPVLDPRRWARCFPRARCCRLAEAARISDWDLHLLRGVTWLSCFGSHSAQFTDVGMAELRGVRHLDLQNSSVALSDRGLLHLPVIETLRFVARGMTDAGLGSIRSVRTLEFEGDADITDRGLAALGPQLRELCIGPALGVGFTDAGVCAIGAGLVRLCLVNLAVVLTDSALLSLPSLQELSISSCPRVQITNRGIAALAHVTTLSFTELDGLVADDAGFMCLGGLEKLHLCSCQRASITDVTFAALSRLHILTISDCAGLNVTDAGFIALARVGTIDFSWNRHARFQISEGGVAALQTVGLIDMTDTGIYFTVAERTQLESRGARAHVDLWADDLSWESDSESHEDLLAFANGLEDDYYDEAQFGFEEAELGFEDGAQHPEAQHPEAQAQDPPESFNIDE